MIYADINASHPLLNEVIEFLGTRMKTGCYGNPSSIHSCGRTLNNNIEITRKICAEVLGGVCENFIFNSGASEGVSSVFKSVLRQSGRKNKILLSSIEHEAVNNAASEYQKNGFDIVLIPVNNDGIVDIAFIRDFLKEHSESTALISVMAANNETGVIQPYREIGEIAGVYHVPYFCDTTQLIGKDTFDFSKIKIDFAVVSGHKIGALPGTGMLYVKDFKSFIPLIYGAGQESGLRGGTQNYIGIETIAVALKALQRKLFNIQQLKNLKNEFEQTIKLKIPDCVIIGEKSSRLCNTSLISFPGIHGQALQIELDANDIFVTTASACGDNEPTPSHVLKAMNISEQVARGIVRISMGLDTTKDQYDNILSVLIKSVIKLKKISQCAVSY